MTDVLDELREQVKQYASEVECAGPRSLAVVDELFDAFAQHHPGLVDHTLTCFFCDAVIKGSEFTLEEGTVLCPACAAKATPEGDSHV